MEQACASTSGSNTEGGSIESRILDACGKDAGGVTDKTLQAALPEVTAQQRVAVLNQLISKGKIELLKKGSELLYKAKSQSQSGACGKDKEEKLVYQIIADSDNEGILPKDIRLKSNLPFTFLNKILKSLESRKLIKSIKPVNDTKKKLYMLYDKEPDIKITGGTWYTGQEFETEFVDVLSEQCFRYLQQAAVTAKEKKLDPVSQRNASCRSTKNICKFINDLGVSKVVLNEADIASILNTLVYDGKVEKIIGRQEGETFYKVLNPVPNLAPLLSMPCGMCTVSVAVLLCKVQGCSISGVSNLQVPKSHSKMHL